MDGILLYDDTQGRYIVQELVNGVITDESKTVDLHCGDCLTVQVKEDDWRDTRIEKDTEDDVFGWYFVKIGRVAPLIGHSVRI